MSAASAGVGGDGPQNAPPALSGAKTGPAAAPGPQTGGPSRGGLATGSRRPTASLGGLRGGVGGVTGGGPAGGASLASLVETSAGSGLSGASAADGAGGSGEVLHMHAQVKAVRGRAFASLARETARRDGWRVPAPTVAEGGPGDAMGGEEEDPEAAAGVALADFRLMWPEYLFEAAEDDADPPGAMIATLYVSGLTASGVAEREVNGMVNVQQRNGSMAPRFLVARGHHLALYDSVEDFMTKAGRASGDAKVGSLEGASSMPDSSPDGAEDSAIASASEAGSGAGDGSGGGGDADAAEEANVEKDDKNMIQLDSISAMRPSEVPGAEFEVATALRTWVFGPARGTVSEEDASRARQGGIRLASNADMPRLLARTMTRGLKDAQSAVDRTIATKYSIELGSTGGIKRKFTGTDTCEDVITELVAHLQKRGESVRRGRYVLKATGYRDYAVLRSRKLWELQYVRECLRERREIKFSVVRFTEFDHPACTDDVGVPIDGAPADSEARTEDSRDSTASAASDGAAETKAESEGGDVLSDSPDGRITEAAINEVPDVVIPGNAVALNDVRVPFRLRVWAVEGAKAETKRVDIVHGEEVVSTVPQRVRTVMVRCVLFMNGAPLPGGEVESREAMFVPEATWWTPADWLNTELLLSDVPEDTRVLLELRALHEGAVESITLASVVLPLLSFEGRLLSGRHALKMWPNHWNTMKGPPGANFIDSDAATLHVEFDYYQKPVVAARLVKMPSSGVTAADAARLGQDPPVEKVGWMHKLGKSKLTVWRRRWFVLRESAGSLQYFHSNLDTEPRGTIELRDVEVTAADSMNKTYQKIVGSTRKTLTTHCFAVRKREKGARTYYMYTLSLQERNEWMDAIAMVSLMAQSSAPEPVAPTPKRRGLFGRLRGSSATSPEIVVDSTASKRKAAKSGRGGMGIAEGRVADVLERSGAKVSGEESVDLADWITTMDEVLLLEPLLPTYASTVEFSERETKVEERSSDSASVGEEKGAEVSASTAAEVETVAAEVGATESQGTESSGEKKKSVGVDALSNDPAMLYSFASHLALAMCEENLLFWIEAESFRKRGQPDAENEMSDEECRAEARRIYDSYISSDNAYASESTVAPGRASFDPSSGSSYEISIGGRKKDVVIAALKDGAPRVPHDVFAEALREVLPPLEESLRQFLDLSVQEVVGGDIDLNKLKAIGRTASAGTVREMDASATRCDELCTWARTRCLLNHVVDGSAALKGVLEAHDVDAEFASECLVQLSCNLMVTSSFISEQKQGVPRLPNGGAYQPRTMDAANRKAIYSILKNAFAGHPGHGKRALSHVILVELLEDRWMALLQDVPFREGGLLDDIELDDIADMEMGSRRASMDDSERRTRSPSLHASPTTRSVRRLGRTGTTLSGTSGRRSSLQSKLALRKVDESYVFGRHRTATASNAAASPIVEGVAAEDEPHVAQTKVTDLHDLLRQDPCYELNAMERALLWRQRAECAKDHPTALPKFLKAFSWVSPERVGEAHRLIQHWKRFEKPMEALELLDDRFGASWVRDYAVSALSDLSDQELLFVLPQLVQGVKYEVHHASPLALFLLERAVRAPNLLGQPLFWAMKVETTVLNPLSRRRFELMIDALLRRCTPRSRFNLEEQERLWARDGVFSEVCESVKRFKKEGGSKSGLNPFLRKELAKVNETLPPKFTLPLDARVEVRRIVPEECKVMTSAKLPLWLSFENADPDGDNVLVMFKSGDDLRQDAVTLQLIRVMDNLWQKQGLSLRLSPYRCISTWNDGGLLEIVRNSATTADIHKDFGGKLLGAYKDSTFVEFLKKHNQKNVEYVAAVENFVRSCAGYCVGTYVMGIGDRHNDNIMVKKSGHYFHIDFGHFLGNFKYQFGVARERSAFVFTPEMAYVMGGKDGAKFKEFVELAIKALSVLRQNGATLVNLFALMVPAGMPELASREDINYLRSMLELSASDEDVTARFMRDLDAALNNKFKRFDNTIHIIKHGL